MVYLALFRQFIMDWGTSLGTFYIDWYFSTIFVDNLATSIGHQPHIS
jgi:hypothetical protein